jgi:hypothetical protein
MPDDTVTCGCGHPAAAHEHYRRGSDCGVCGREVCRAFRAARVEPAVAPVAMNPVPRAIARLRTVRAS